jgi:hypothetical protein
MVQNIIENQLYVSVANDKDNNFIISKYCECDTNPIEDDLCQDDDYSGNILLERLVINAVPIPSMTEWTKQSLGITNKVNKKVLIYDYDNENLKVNEARTAVGVVYQFENSIFIHCLYNIKDMLSHCYKIIDAQIVRENIFSTLLSITNDNLLAEYVLLFITSQILGRVSGHLLGKITLNIKGSDTGLVERLNQFISNLAHFALNIDVTIDNMNKLNFAPRYDPETDELAQGIFQTVDHTFIILNELKLEQGTLNMNGLKNYETVKNLINFQSFYYDYPYSKVEIYHNNPIIVFSPSKSLFDTEPQMIIVNYYNLGKIY